MTRAYYSDTIAGFLQTSDEALLGHLTQQTTFNVELTQRGAWQQQIRILKAVLVAYPTGHLFLEYDIPRMGRRIDAVIIIANAVLVIEFKVGDTAFHRYAIDQVWDYALDLKNFHRPSHKVFIAPILVATAAPEALLAISTSLHNDNVLTPIWCNKVQLPQAIEQALFFAEGANIDPQAWASGPYSPTPTIIEAAAALYANHTVADITRRGAEEENLNETSMAVSEVISQAKQLGKKALCFVTGVPGAGKTLVGLNIVTQHLDSESSTSSVFLSGNGPLVAVLREALTRDKVRRGREAGHKISKSKAGREVKLFIQNVHHFRDDCLADPNPPHDHVAIFDEAQRAWDHRQTASFMARKKNQPNFAHSESAFLISCLDRHPDWAVIVCLVGGGQEINTGEAGISEWIVSLNRSFPHWEVYVSDQLTDSEYAAGDALRLLAQYQAKVHYKPELHLSVSMRSYRAEYLSLMVKQLLDLQPEAARATWQHIKDNYPIVLTRDAQKAKQWLKQRARGNERYGIVVSSQAYRLRPYAIDVRVPIDPVHWFLDDKDDVRSSYYLEDVATEFQVQGLELDWACVTWDADFRHHADGWQTFAFKGSRWERVLKAERKQYLKNAYRVLLTRARQGMVIVVPKGDPEDHTRSEAFYDGTYEYLKGIGFPAL
ncbi:DUF2075 domain-containing protein [Parapedobacter koreensis]|uniref:Uncharacterized conserved protein n=1 Tax=Parapedobacter koreensis TaxID=332977 RepID=A0A1H7PYP3_9SPHI|nr:DUF2075 domain-containing protein [Parapedobacter koreensis]SEL40950.1 Uncharacterized conserved protein [Parapedobacter koreensis]